MEKEHFSVVRDLVGHGIGTSLHEDPEISNYVTKTKGVRLRAGMTIAVEPMVLQGKKDVYIADNDWSVIAKDGKLTAHYENSVLITKDEPVLLTLPKQ